MFPQALKSREIPPNLNKGCILWTLRQLCACVETLPKSCVLQVEFNPTDPHNAAGGFADVWKGMYNDKEVAFKSIRGSIQAEDAVRLRRKVRYDVSPRPGASVTSLHCFREGFARKWYYGSR